jgi:hypothetical protein
MDLFSSSKGIKDSNGHNGHLWVICHMWAVNEPYWPWPWGDAYMHYAALAVGSLSSLLSFLKKDGRRGRRAAINQYPPDPDLFLFFFRPPVGAGPWWSGGSVRGVVEVRQRESEIAAGVVHIHIHILTIVL